MECWGVKTPGRRVDSMKVTMLTGYRCSCWPAAPVLKPTIERGLNSQDVGRLVVTSNYSPSVRCRSEHFRCCNRYEFVTGLRL